MTRRSSVFAGVLGFMAGSLLIIQPIGSQVVVAQQISPVAAADSGDNKNSYDPESPAAFEYKLPFMDTRELGSRKDEKSELFGHGIKVPARQPGGVVAGKEEVTELTGSDVRRAFAALSPATARGVAGLRRSVLGSDWTVVTTCFVGLVLGLVAARRRKG